MAEYGTVSRLSEPAPYFQVFEQTLDQSTVRMLRSVVDQTLGRRESLSEGQRDHKWWISLLDIRKIAGDDTVAKIIAPLVGSPAIQSSMTAVGDDPVAVLHYCILRRFDPGRNPVPAQWHFDANILGTRTQMINTWHPLVDVGETAPGLTLVRGARRPARLWQRLVDSADAAGMFNAESRRATLFSDADVEAAIDADPEAALVTPVVPAGGAISFDHLHLHGTQRLMPQMGMRESFEFRVMSEKTALDSGLANQYGMIRLYTPA